VRSPCGVFRCSREIALTNRTFASSLILLLIILPLPVQGQSLSWPQIGFNCCHVYDFDSGAPVFMLGEELWLRTDNNLTITLENPNGRIISRNLSAGSAIRLYQFRQGDAAGTWRLGVHGAGQDRTVSLHVLSDQLNASMKALSFGLRNDQLLVDGTLTTQLPHQGGVIILARKNGNNSLTSSPVRFIEGSLQTTVSWGQANSRAITVALQPSSLNRSYLGRVWAEISSEASLSKEIGNGEIFVSLRQLVARTHTLAMNFTSQRKLTFGVDLPELHTVGLDGQIPLRPGPILLTIYVQIGTIVFSATVDAFLSSDGIISSVVDSFPIPPLQPQTDFELKDELQSTSEYKLLLFAKEFGVNALWNAPIIPPLTRVRITNKLTNSPITDYEIDSNQIQGFVRIGANGFIIPRATNQEARLNVSIGGISLNPSEFAPNSAKLQPLSTLEISASASNVMLSVTDQFGNFPQSGTMRITRSLEGNKSISVDRAWASENGIINLTLPLGVYTVSLSAHDSTVTQSVSLQKSTERFDLTLNGLILEQSRNELLLISLMSAIILIEIFVAVRVWRRVLKKIRGSDKFSS